jgi:hypothetical protein
MRDVSELLSIAHRRMRSSLLWHEPSSAPEDVVGWFGAAQAQEYEPAKWAVAMRTAGAGNADLDRLVDEGRILRTHALRPTWHFVLAEDIVWLQALTGPRVHVLNGHYYRLLDLDEKLLARCERLIGRWLDEDGELTRKEIGERLGVEGIEAKGNRLAYIMASSELNAVVCSGRRRGATHTYALISRRAPDALHLTEDQALRQLTVRYFQSHGPATIGDFRWWSSLTVAQIRRGLELAGDRLHREKLGDHEVWSVDPTSVRPPAHPTVHLLQPYDEYTVAYADTKRAVDAAGVATPPDVIDGRAFYHALIIDGQLAGWWRRRVNRAHIELEVRPSRELSEAECELLGDAGRAYGRFHGLPVRWEESVGAT